MYFPLVDIYSSGVERIWPSSNLTVNNIWIVWISHVIWLISMIVWLFSRVIDWLQWLYCLLPSHCTTWLIDWLSVLLEQDVAKAASLQWCDWLIDCVFYKSRTRHRQPPYSGVIDWLTVWIAWPNWLIDWLTVCSTGAGRGTGSRPTAVWLIDWLCELHDLIDWLIDWLCVLQEHDAAQAAALQRRIIEELLVGPEPPAAKTLRPEFLRLAPPLFLRYR